MIQHHDTMASPIGPLTIAADGAHITAVHMGDKSSLRARMAHVSAWEGSSAIIAEACAQLTAYFAGRLHEFDLPLAPRGGDFQRRVWSALQRIPYGVTTSYGAIASAIAAPGSARAVGAANGQNPIAIVIPCHRVIGADGSLTGYGGGLERKRFLLELETRGAGVQLGLEMEGEASGARIG